MRRRLVLRNGLLTAALMAGAITSALPVWAQTAPPTRVRGSIVGLQGNTLTVATRSGEKMDITLADPVTVMTVKKVDLASISPGSFIGTATRTNAEGKMTAIEVLVFPEAMRGSGEGHYEWDLEPGSMMTNGTVKGAVSAASGRELSVGYKDDAKTVHVADNAPVVTFAPATKDDLKTGAKVFLAAAKGADGKMTAARVIVGKDGVDPPM